MQKYCFYETIVTNPAAILGERNSGPLLLLFFLLIYDIFYIYLNFIFRMTRHEFERKVTDLIKRYRLGRSMKEDEKLLDTLNTLFLDFNSTVENVSERPRDIQKKMDGTAEAEGSSIFSSGELPGVRKGKQPKRGSTMKFNKHSFPSEKPNFGLKLNKLFSAFITEYGPEYITLVISDSILYTNNLILRIDLQTKEVLIGSSKSIKLYETKEGGSFLITEKPEVIPYGSTNGFYFKNITYEDILNLTNGDFFKVFSADILKTYKGNEITLPEELEKVGYYRFE